MGETYLKMLALMDCMGSDEWLGYLVGEKKEAEQLYVVDDIIIPEQEVTATSVDVTDPQTPARTIGTAHSHHNMGAFMSHTDDHFIGTNHDVTVVISHSGWKQQVREALPCGMIRLVDAELDVVFPDGSGTKEFIGQAKGQVKKKTFATYQSKQPSAPSHAEPTKPSFTREPTEKLVAVEDKDGERKIVDMRKCDLCGDWFDILDLRLVNGMQCCKECISFYDEQYSS
jgi:hypothetical protein